MNDISEKQKQEWTKELLMHVAQHLSGKALCNHIEYIVDICIPSSFSYSQISMEDLTHINSNVSEVTIKHRNEAVDEAKLFTHILRNHMNQLVIDCGDINPPAVNKDYLIPGRYRYQFSATKKTRRWVKER